MVAEKYQMLKFRFLKQQQLIDFLIRYNIWSISWGLFSLKRSPNELSNTPSNCISEICCFNRIFIKIVYDGLSAGLRYLVSLFPSVWVVLDIICLMIELYWRGLWEIFLARKFCINIHVIADSAEMVKLFFFPLFAEQFTFNDPGMVLQLGLSIRWVKNIY